MENELKRILSEIIKRRMETKARLQMMSFLFDEKNKYEKEINGLLDELKMLDELERRITRK